MYFGKFENSSSVGRNTIIFGGLLCVDPPADPGVGVLCGLIEGGVIFSGVGGFGGDDVPGGDDLVEDSTLLFDLLNAAATFAAIISKFVIIFYITFLFLEVIYTVNYKLFTVYFLNALVNLNCLFRSLSFTQT